MEGVLVKSSFLLVLIFPLTVSAQAVSDVDRQQLQRDGHIFLSRALSSTDLRGLRENIISTARGIVDRCAQCENGDDIFDRDCVGCERTKATPAGFPKSFEKAKNVHRRSAAIRKFIMSGRLPQLAGNLLGVDAVRLYQDTAFFKIPGDVESAWHQDQTAAPLSVNDTLITVWIPLDESTAAEQGTLAFATESHRRQTPISMQGLALPDRIGAMRHLRSEEVAKHYVLSEPRAFQLGDVSVHLGWTYHRAGPNSRSRTRHALAVSYFADGAKIDQNFLHISSPMEQAPPGIEFLTADGSKTVAQTIKDDLSTWLPWLLNGFLVPGDTIDTPMTPLIKPH